jgi:hypothetical protein
VVVVLDQLTKLWVLTSLPEYTAIPVIDGFWNWYRTYNMMDILLANPRGFCAGVDRAIEIVERALELFGAPIYVRHEVVHNRFVVDA